jgi:hypothetical protein
MLASWIAATKPVDIAVVAQTAGSSAVVLDRVSAFEAQ